MRTRRAMGTSALDSVLGPSSNNQHAQPDRNAQDTRRTEVQRGKGANAAAAGKVRATFHLPAELLEEARDCVVALSGPPVHLTLADLAAAALGRELERLKKAHNGGKAFGKRRGELKGGRPVKR